MNFETKYRPQTFNDLVFSDGITQKRLLDYANNRRHGNIIFHGPFGTAKSTTARLIQKMRVGALKAGGPWDYHASAIDEGTFEIFPREWTIQKLAGVHHPLTVIDEIDQLKQALQHRFGPLMDRTDWGSFILTTNNLHNVDKGIADRCDVIELPAANQSAWFDRAKFILQTEGINLPDEHIKGLLSTTNGSIRDLMRCLEDAVIRLSKTVPAQGTQPPTPVAPMSVQLIPPIQQGTTP